MKITSFQLRRIIQEEARRILREADEPVSPEIIKKQADLYQTLEVLEDTLKKLINHVNERKAFFDKNPREEGAFPGPNQFGKDRDGKPVDLMKVLAAVTLQRDIEGSAESFGGGMYQLPGND